MTRDDIIRMAREAELHCHVKLTEHGLIIEDLQYFAALVAAHEREACAKLCDRMPDLVDGWRANLPSDCAAAIRERGEK